MRIIKFFLALNLKEGVFIHSPEVCACYPRHKEGIVSLSSFSSLLDFAIGQQKEALSFFTSSLNNPCVTHKENLETARNEAEKNIKNLETILRENITEMVMEPLEGLNETNYSPQTEGVDAGQALINIFEKQKLFFQDAARVINLKDVKRLFEKMSAKTELLISEIKERIL